MGFQIDSDAEFLEMQAYRDKDAYEADDGKGVSSWIHFSPQYQRFFANTNAGEENLCTAADDGSDWDRRCPCDAYMRGSAILDGTMNSDCVFSSYKHRCTGSKGKYPPLAADAQDVISGP